MTTMTRAAGAAGGQQQHAMGYTHGSPLADKLITCPMVFEATMVHAAALHRVSPEQLSFTLRTVHAHELATAGVIHGCAERLAHAGYMAAPAPPVIDPALAAEVATFKPEYLRAPSRRKRAPRAAARAA